MRNHYRSDNPFDIPASGEHPMRELLPEYATSAALGSAPERAYPHVATHLAVCAACRVELAELLSMTTEVYAGQVVAAPRRPAADLSFLNRPAPAPAAQPQPWMVDGLGRLIVTFSEQLLESLRRPALAGAWRGQLLYRYALERGSVHGLDVMIEVFSEDEARGLGRVRVGVDVASRGSFDQSGNEVVLRADNAIWQDQTDALGSVDFESFPLDALPRLRVQITPNG